MKPIEYGDPEKLKQKILGMKNKEAEKRGVRRETLWKIKKKIREEKVINWKTKSVNDLILSQLCQIS